MISFTYDSAQISQIAELTQTGNFTYDNVDRLTGMTNGTAPESYTFNAVGSRTASHRSASYAYQPFNRLTGTAAANYSYDANGNMTRKFEWGGRRWTYYWDYENRLARATNHKQTVRYRYDALGRRVQRYIVGGKESTKFIHDGLDVIMDDDTASGTTKYQNGLGIDNKLKLTNAGNAKYYLQDHLGSTVGLTDSTGVVLSSASYDSFGNPTGNLTTRYQYTGREYDPLTGLHFYRARWYDANLGRFILEDPIGFGGGDINWYGYVKNGPLRFKDPLGLQTSPNYPSCVAAYTTVFGIMGFGAGGGFGALAGPGGFVTIPFGAWVGSGLGGASGGVLGSVVCGTPPFPGTFSPPLSTPSRPYCEPMSRPFPLTRAPTMPWPTGPDPDREGCAEEISDCHVLCEEQALSDPGRYRNILGKGYNDCMSSCITERCKKGTGFR